VAYLNHGWLSSSIVTILFFLFFYRQLPLLMFPFSYLNGLFSNRLVHEDNYLCSFIPSDVFISKTQTSHLFAIISNRIRVSLWFAKLSTNSLSEEAGPPTTTPFPTLLWSVLFCCLYYTQFDSIFLEIGASWTLSVPSLISSWLIGNNFCRGDLVCSTRSPLPSYTSLYQLPFLPLALPANWPRAFRFLELSW
jgi:hypothetical protein